MLFIVGPSHVPRWRHVINTLGYPKPEKDVTFVGDGGYPIWHRSSFERVKREFKDGDKIYLIVGDFRFGNRRVTEWPFSPDEVFKDGYTHVVRDFIEAQSDQRMKALCLAALAEWRKEFGQNVFIFQWTLAMQAVQCRLERRYIDQNNVLVHPSWNIVEMSIFANDVDGMSRFADPDATKMKSLFVDRDLHPSALGYLYLTEVFKTKNHEAAFSSAFRLYRVAFDRIFNALERGGPRNVIIAGDSVVMGVMDRAIPYEFRTRLEALGIRLALSPTSAIPSMEPGNELIFVSNALLDDDGGATRGKWEELRQKYQGVAERMVIVPWEALYHLMNPRRGRYSSGERIPLKEHELDALRDAADLDYLDLIENGSIHRLIEHGAGGAPTLEGIFFILSLAAGVRQLLVRPFGNPA